MEGDALSDFLSSACARFSKSHAREIARLALPTVHYVMVEPPKPEVLRVLYMTANPETDLRTEVEVRDVQQAVKRALHRDLIDVQYRPAATPEDLLDGLNDVRPHVVHFSGHAGDAAVLFDNASVDNPEGTRWHRRRHREAEGSAAD